MTQGGEDEVGIDRNCILHMTPMETATTVNTKANEPTIIKMVLIGNFPISPDKVMDDEDPVNIMIGRLKFM